MVYLHLNVTKSIIFVQNIIYLMIFINIYMLNIRVIFFSKPKNNTRKTNPYPSGYPHFKGRNYF